MLVTKEYNLCHQFLEAKVSVQFRQMPVMSPALHVLCHLLPWTYTDSHQPSEQRQGTGSCYSGKRPEWLWIMKKSFSSYITAYWWSQRLFSPSFMHLKSHWSNMSAHLLVNHHVLKIYMLEKKTIAKLSWIHWMNERIKAVLGNDFGEQISEVPWFLGIVMGQEKMFSQAGVHGCCFPRLISV